MAGLEQEKEFIEKIKVAKRENAILFSNPKRVNDSNLTFPIRGSISRRILQYSTFLFYSVLINKCVLIKCTYKTLL